MTRIYQQTDALIYKNIRQDSAVRLIFLSGLGLPIRKQWEPFFQRFALKNGISYMALDYTQHALQYKRSERFQTDTFFDKTKSLLENCPEKKFLFFGACFGGLMGLKLMQVIPNKISGAVLTSPAHEIPSFPWKAQADAYLRQKFNKQTEKDKTEKDNYSFYHLKYLAVFHCLFTAISPLVREQISYPYRGPMTIFHGEKASLIPVQNSREIQRTMQNPNLDLQIIPKAGHIVGFDIRQPLAVLKRYLDNIKSPRQ